MDLQNEKCVMVIDENLPLGIIANTAAIMGITLGKQMPGCPPSLYPADSHPAGIKVPDALSQ